MYRLFCSMPRAALPGSIILVLALGMIADFAIRYDGPSVGLVSALVLFPTIIWVGAHVELGGATRAAATWLGRISYSLYITHEPLFDGLSFCYRLQHWDPKTSFWLNLVCWAALAVAVAWLLDRIYDMPVRAFLTHRFSRRAAALASALP